MGGAVEAGEDRGEARLELGEQHGGRVPSLLARLLRRAGGRRERRAVEVLDDGGEQRLLGREVAVERLARERGLLGDRFHAGLPVAVATEGEQRGVDDPLSRGHADRVDRNRPFCQPRPRARRRAHDPANAPGRQDGDRHRRVERHRTRDRRAPRRRRRPRLPGGPHPRGDGGVEGAHRGGRRARQRRRPRRARGLAARGAGGPRRARDGPPRRDGEQRGRLLSDADRRRRSQGVAHDARDERAGAPRRLPGGGPCDAPVRRLGPHRQHLVDRRAPEGLGRLRRHQARGELHLEHAAPRAGGGLDPGRHRDARRDLDELRAPLRPRLRPGLREGLGGGGGGEARRAPAGEARSRRCLRRCARCSGGPRTSPRRCSTPSASRSR